MADTFDLARFVQAQNPVLEQVLDELRAGHKRSHWMWFVFPQLRGLGHSPMAQHYGIGSLEEARAYVAHPVLGPRLIACTDLVNAIEDRSAHAIFGSPDDMKFHACMTLFQTASPETPAFGTALARYFDGVPHAGTRALLR
ncbi:MAG: DUF1810 domain-containing protein [Rhodospirillales bacterium]|nr:DUF1810 domain-containing protein [Rhodospirillales bacterium]MBN8898689.1 DUF1810 domain-containing protein [Rhodospirillales bacterium]